MRDLGVVLDSRLTLSVHVAALCRSGYYQLRQLHPLVQSMTVEAARIAAAAFISCRLDYCSLQCFDTVGGAGMVVCLERGADLHVAQLMPLPLTVSCFSKIQIGLLFWYWPTWVVPGKGPLNVCVCVWITAICCSTVCWTLYCTNCSRCRMPLHD